MALASRWFDGLCLWSKDRIDESADTCRIEALGGHESLIENGPTSAKAVSSGPGELGIRQ